MNFRKLTILLLLFALVGCGYIKAGTWENDSNNWNRAFDSTKPPDVTVIHSKYWRSPHWTYEYQYFFEIAPNVKLKTQLFTENKLRQVTDNEANRVKNNVFGDSPSWFAPKSDKEYEVWVYAENPNSNFKVLIDKKSGVMFLNDYQA